MVELITEEKNEKILDPGVGEGVFLESLIESGFKNSYGYEIDIDRYQNLPEKIMSKVKNIDFLHTPSEEKFDVIIGNPPYVHWNDIIKTTLKILNNDSFWKPLVNGEWDLLYAFIIWAIKKLKEGGELIFIVPYYWFYSTFAFSLRDYMMYYGYFNLIIHFGEYKLFPDCAPNNIIFRYIKKKGNYNSEDSKLIKVIEYNQRKGDTKYILKRINDFIHNFSDPNYIYQDDSFKFFFQNQFENNLIWTLQTNNEYKMIKKIENATLSVIPSLLKKKELSLANSNSLFVEQNDKIEIKNENDQIIKVTELLDEKDLKQLRVDKQNLEKIHGYYHSPKKPTQYLKLKQILNIGVGMVSGFDKGFRVDPKFLDKLTTKERGLITYFVKGKNCERYWLDDSTPYIFADNINSELKLKENYPHIFNHLEGYRHSLEKRYKPKRVKYYQWATVRNYTVFTENFENEKIFVPCLDRHKKTRFSYTTRPLFGSGDVLVITQKNNFQLKESLKYICAWLNSENITEWYDLKGSKRGHRRAFTQTRVEEIPIRLINWNDHKEVRIYNQIIEQVDDVLQHQKVSQKHEEIINSLFNMLIDENT